MNTTLTTIPRRSIANYPNYSVDADGTVYGPKGPLRPSRNGRGYSNISLVKWAGGLRAAKSHSVHRIVIAAFREQPPGYIEVNHINGDKADNRLDNLEWVTSSANKLHATAHGLYPVGQHHHNYVDGSSDRGRINRRSIIKQQYQPTFIKD